MKTITSNECSRMLKATLKEAFPGTRFSVVVRRYAGGHSTDVKWADGPTEIMVREISDRYASRGFDSMTDCPYFCGKRILCGCEVEVNGGKIFLKRSISDRFRQFLRLRIAEESEVAVEYFYKLGPDAPPLIPFAFRPPETALELWDLPERILSAGESSPRILAEIVARHTTTEPRREDSSELLPEYRFPAYRPSGAGGVGTSWRSSGEN